MNTICYKLLFYIFRLITINIQLDCKLESELCKILTYHNNNSSIIDIRL